MNYIEYRFQINPLQPGSEILIAELAEAGFESFVETEYGLLAYIPQKDWNENILNNIRLLQSTQYRITFGFSEIKQINWNEEWEKNFTPIILKKQCTIRAPFHPKAETDFDIVIEPKMSFGTGHHETTRLMLQHILENRFQNKKVLDMGCGTAVLAILADKKGAQLVDAVDIDDWCYQNALENIERNNCLNTTAHQDDVSFLKNKNYDIILANINRNVLLTDLPAYVQSLHKPGELYLSGFYAEDIPQVESACNKLQLSLTKTLLKNNWAAIKLMY